jgi:hypothetical protein
MSLRIALLFGSGLIGQGAILLLAIAGFVLPAILCAWLARMWKPGGLMAKPVASVKLDSRSVRLDHDKGR